MVIYSMLEFNEVEMADVKSAREQLPILKIDKDATKKMAKYREKEERKASEGGAAV